MLRKMLVSALLTLTIAFSVQGATLSDQQKRAVKDAIGEKLVDPYSAVFTFDLIIKKNGIVTVCGTVNAKNRMGGYNGKEPFAATMLQGKVALSEIFDGMTLDQLKNGPICNQ